MAATSYNFITRWQIKAPVEQVWDVIYDADQWPNWWKGVVSVKDIDNGNAEGINSIKEYVWKSQLPYQLSFKMKLKKKEKYKLLSGEASGELEGRGTWFFGERDGITYVQYDWKVITNKPWMNRFSFLLKPLFNYNHNIVMQWGAEGLAKKINAELISY
jgi:carbon monoxide dehydrogenase subunit G